jgi:hypothetical protein
MSMNFYTIYQRNQAKNIETILFFFNRPMYARIYAPILAQIQSERKLNLYIFCTGKATDFVEEKKEIKWLMRTYKLFFTGTKTMPGLSCDYLFTTTPDLVDKLEQGEMIRLPYLSRDAMTQYARLFTSDMYFDGMPFQNKSNAFVQAFNDIHAILTKYDVERPVRQRDPQKIRLVILAQLPNLWQSAQSLWEEMRSDDRCEPEIVQLPFLHANYTEQEDIGSYLKVKKIPFTYWNHYDIYLEKPDIVIFLSPYDSTRPQDYHFASIQSQCSKTVYVQYALEISGGFIIDYFFRQPIHIGCWKNYVRSERYKELFQKYCPRGNDNVVVTGHPKMDLIYRLESHIVYKELADKIAGRKVILWNPHHTLMDDGWGTFLEWNPVLMRLFREQPDIVLIVRPHPLLFKNLRSYPEGNIALEEFMHFASESNNIIIDTSEEYLDAFRVSDALISDESSLLLEYLPTRKPILFTPKAGRSLLNDDGEELVRHLYIGRTESDLCNFVGMTVAHEDPMFEDRVTQIDLLLYHVDGKAGHRIKEDMLACFMTV